MGHPPSDTDAGQATDLARQHLQAIAIETFASMMGISATVASHAPEFGESQPTIAATVAFAGAWEGYVSLVTSHDAAGRLTEALLGEVATTADQLRDAMSELANIVGGGFRSRMAADFGVWTLTVPVVATGTGLRVRPAAGAWVTRLPVAFDGHVLDVHLVVTARSPQ